jgi:hypothetical protein
MVLDRTGASALKRWGRRPATPPLDGSPRLALVTVNFSTTRYLELMLLTLAEQERLDLVERIVVVDNGSRDGGIELLRQLAAEIPRLHLVERRHRLTHGAGMRAGVRALDRLDAGSARPANVVLFCDADVVFRDRRALATVAEAIAETSAALVGEVRAGANAELDIQASFYAVRRDVLARRDIAPLVHDGAPAYRMQRSIWAAGLPVVNLPTNHGGLILHRGRAGVEAAARFRPRHQYARVTTSPHFMGVPGGAAIWAEVEARWADLLEPAAADELVARLVDRLAGLGATS